MLPGRETPGAVDQDVHFQVTDDGGQRGGVGQVHHVRDCSRAVGQFGEAFLVAGHRVDGQSALGEPFGDGSAHAGGRSGDEGCGVVGKRHWYSKVVEVGRALASGNGLDVVAPGWQGVRDRVAVCGCGPGRWDGHS